MKTFSYIHLLAFFISAVFLISACSGSKKMIESENFDQFYSRFHQDEDFQLSRIVFPLEGGSAQVNETIPWTMKNWITMKTEIYDVDQNTYEVSYSKTEDSFTQKFQLKGSGFGAEYRFKKINNKWYLVYALDSNL